MRALDAVALPQSGGIPNESQALSQRITFSPNQDLQLIPPLINLLMSIEPDVVYAGHDNTKPDTSSSLLTSLNQLGERQLLSVVKWSKSLPGNNNLYIQHVVWFCTCGWLNKTFCAISYIQCKQDIILCFSSSKYLSRSLYYLLLVQGPAMCHGNTKDIDNTWSLIDESRITYLKQLRNSISVCIQQII